jgi:hypothetical protein
MIQGRISEGGGAISRMLHRARRGVAMRGSGGVVLPGGRPCAGENLNF